MIGWYINVNKSQYSDFDYQKHSLVSTHFFLHVDKPLLTPSTFYIAVEKCSWWVIKVLRITDWADASMMGPFKSPDPQYQGTNPHVYIDALKAKWENETVLQHTVVW